MATLTVEVEDRELSFFKTFLTVFLLSGLKNS
jgi:hypothetical protein